MIGRAAQVLNVSCAYADMVLLTAYQTRADITAALYARFANIDAQKNRNFKLFPDPSSPRHISCRIHHPLPSPLTFHSKNKPIPIIQTTQFSTRKTPSFMAQIYIEKTSPRIKQEKY
eukprot:GHVP01032502.1.p1 GENE.GHVP01032502.1~~GHVP01032502.1.p1  ORF type:complete len:117 (-),score=5.76 GHVP01032502.1:519-869(-)